MPPRLPKREPKPSASTAQACETQAWCLEPDLSRAQSIQRVCGELGLACQLGSECLLRQRANRQNDAVVIASLGAGTFASGAEASIERLRRNGFHVIAYTADCSHWPARKRCAPLLAGAIALLDTTTPTFSEELHSTLAALMSELATIRKEQHVLAHTMRGLGIAGESGAMVDLFRQAARVAKFSDLPVLVMGETGTGKELLVRAIHRMDPKRREGPLVCVNCAAINDPLAESEFFGHRRGAFTGAERDRKGYFRTADGGVLFLDEVGDLPASLQDKLLRALQEGQIQPVGADHGAHVDVRVLAATNRDLHRMMKERLFREDLYHRLSVVTLDVPPLRQRPADVPPLVRHFIRRHQSLCPHVDEAAPDLLEALSFSQLPGNARQLENLVRQAMINHRAGNRLVMNDLSRTTWQELGDIARDFAPEPDPPSLATEPGPRLNHVTGSDSHELLTHFLGRGSGSLSERMDRCERLILQNALRDAEGNQSATARSLGLTARTIYNKLRKHQLAP